MEEKISNKIVIFFISLLVVVLILCLKAPISYASLAGHRYEFGTRPEPPTPEDAQPTQVEQRQTSISRDIIEYQYHYTGISGNAYEILDETFRDSNGNPRDNIFSKVGIGGILVQAGAYTTITDLAGNYSFDSLPAGTYQLKFTYGMLDGNPYQNKRNILKYNGYDYKVGVVPGDTTVTTRTVTETEIRYAGKGCEQIMLAIDCSASVRNMTTQIDGIEKSKMDVIVDSTENLIHSLLSSGENIYVGLVFFSGTSYLAQGPIKNEDILKRHLEDIRSNGWYTANTDLVSALNKCKDSLIDVEGGSNRHIIILSDGVPTADGDENDRIYNDDSISEIYAKFERIKQRTIEKIDQIEGSGVSVKSIYIDPKDEEENDYIKQIFHGHVDYFEVMDGDEFIREITQSLREELIRTTEEAEYRETLTIDEGKEDPERRRQVDNNFSRDFYYNNSNYSRAKLFEQIESQYEYNESLAKELSDLTWMVVDGGTYTINESGGGREESYVIEGTEDDEEGPAYHRIIHVDVQYSHRDIGLVQRPALDLQLSITATGARVVSAKENLLYEEQREMGTMDPLKFETDDELLWGTRAYIEYTVEVSNKSSLQCNYLSIMVYLPKNFGLDDNAKFITENSTNATYGWAKYDLENLKNTGIITNEAYEAHKNEIPIIATFRNDGTPNSFYIAPGGSRKFKFVASRVTTGELDMSKEDTIIDAEIIGYADNCSNLYGDTVHRRMATSGTKISSTGRTLTAYLKGVYPGNNKEHDLGTTTNSFCLLPILGEEKENNITYIAIGSISILSLIGVNVILFRLRKARK